MPATHDTRPHRRRAWRFAAVAALALTASGCLSRNSGPSVTGSIDAGAPPDTARRDLPRLASRYEADPGDVGGAMAYAQALRVTDQKPQAVAVLQQTALRNPKNPAVLAAYGKSLAEVGRFAEASEVLRNAHSPANPDWRVLSAQGAVADQTGDHPSAQRYYEAALKIAPGEPAVLTNLGLSYALAKRLPEAEAEQVLTRDLGPAEAAQNVAALRASLAQPNAWQAIRSAEKGGPKPRRAAALAN